MSEHYRLMRWWPDCTWRCEDHGPEHEHQPADCWRLEVQRGDGWLPMTSAGYFDTKDAAMDAIEALEHLVAETGGRWWWRRGATWPF